MRKFFKKEFGLILLSAVFIILFGMYVSKNDVLSFNDYNDIDRILQTKEYNYLPKKAQNYIKEVYEKTGEIILTEKNKKDNTTYLNPEYIEYLELSDDEKEEVDLIPMTTVVDYSPRDIQSSIDIPSSYDLRNVDGNNYVTPVRNQGNLGICWTFATAGALESHLLKKYNTPYNSTNSKLISERQIDYITSKDGIKNYKSEYVSFINRNLGNGGNIYISTIAIANGVSVNDYNNFKEYNDKDLTKMELSDVINYSKSMYEVDSTINMPRLNLRESTSILTADEKEMKNNYLQEIKHNIMLNGAAYASTYMDSSCRYVDSNLNNTVIDVYHCSLSGGHAMEIIGWDDNLEYSYCADTFQHNSDTTNCGTVVSGKGVWILKNSWGDELQYPYLTYDSMYTGVSFINELSKTSDRNWDNNYVIGEENELKTKSYTLSDTKIRNSELLKKIKFISETSDTLCQVNVYKKDGNYETFSKKNSFPGLITIDINKDILVDQNTKLTIDCDGTFMDKVSIFTSNVDKNPYIDLDKYNNEEISKTELRLYSDTKNIPSDATITYKIYNSNNVDVSDKITVTNNIIAENNVNTLVNFSEQLDSGEYRIDAIYNSKIISSINIKTKSMDGTGTEDDPYVITNPIQLDQIRNDLDGYYVLGNDIDLTEATRDGGELSVESSVCPQGMGWKSIEGFSGTLDGQGHSIKGLYQKNYITCNDDARNLKYSDFKTGNGLFSTAKGSVTIKNLIFEGFDITCSKEINSGGDCGALISKYRANGNNDNDVYNTLFENIIVRNGTMRYGNESPNGIFGYIENMYGNIKFSNIYLDNYFDNTHTYSGGTSYFIKDIQGNKVDIENIMLMGIYNGKNDDNSGYSVLSYTSFVMSEMNVSNILSTLQTTKVGGQLFGSVWGNGENFKLNGANLFKTDQEKLAYRFDSIEKASLSNINIYDSNKKLVELTKRSNYNSWKDFDDNWVMKTIDGVPRIPVLKFVDFEYTKISDINIKQELNNKVTIYDYLTPKTETARRINFKSNDENIVEIDDNGVIIPKSGGSTTIHVESLYDGYIKDVPINIDYVPNYKIYFDANGGTGEMDWYEVNANEDSVLPMNLFEKEHYEFNGWNTKADGTGTFYSDLGTVKAMNDGESLTLYAQWIGEKLLVRFDANGGTVNPDKKIVRYGETYGELPIPVRDGYAFTGWSTKGTNRFVIDYLTTKLYGLDLEADWRENAYTIVFDGNGGIINEESNYFNILSNSLVSTFGLIGKDKTLEKNNFVRKHYEFKEWNTKSDGTGISYTDEETINLSSVENSLLRLYAIWIPDKNSYDISIDSDNVVSDIFTINLSVNPLSDNANNIKNLIGNINYDKNKLELVKYHTIDDFNVSLSGDRFDISSNDGINKNSDILILEFKNIGLNELDKTTITFNGLVANNGDLSLAKDGISKDIIYSKSGFIKGDMNHNGKIDLKDIIILIKKYLGTIDSSNEDIVIGDMNSNNKIDLKDIILLIKTYLQV